MSGEPNSVVRAWEPSGLDWLKAFYARQLFLGEDLRHPDRSKICRERRVTGELAEVCRVKDAETVRQWNFVSRESRSDFVKRVSVEGSERFHIRRIRGGNPASAQSEGERCA